jgi:hypothetical protein
MSYLATKFFEEYEIAIAETNLEVLGSLYSDSFMFSGPNGAQVVRKEDFLKAVPKRGEFFKSIGLRASKICSLEENQLDTNHLMVKSHWKIRFDKESIPPIEEQISATYILFRQGDQLKIVFQLDHQDLVKRAAELGLLPAKN